MNHNFADYELTQFLPEKNPFGLLNKWCVEKEITELKKDGYGKPMLCDDWDTDEFFYEQFRLLRDAWTWEDIRLYLKDKGFVFNIIAVVDDTDNLEIPCQILYTWNIIKLHVFEETESYDYVDSYEEARREAIIYCLNLINHGKSN